MRAIVASTLSRLVLAAFVAAAASGCARNRPPDPLLDEVSERLNDDYRAGYGFGNPNNDRRTQGLPPLDMPSYQKR